MTKRRCPACRSKRISEHMEAGLALVCRACRLTFPPYPPPTGKSQRVTNPVNGKTYWRQVK